MLLENKYITTQSVDAVKQLIACAHNGQEPEEMPPFYRMSDELVLVLNSKRDCYYVTTLNACSCPSFIYRGGPCKHQRKYFVESKPRGQSMAVSVKEHDWNLHKMPRSYRRMVRLAREEADAEDDSLMKHEGFRPVYPEDETSRTQPPKTNQDQEA